MSPRLPRTQPEPQSPSEATTPLLRPRVALALLVALLLVALTVQIADARLPRARPYRVGGPIGLDTNLLSESGASAWAIDAYLDATTRLPHLGAAFMAAERTYGINARFLLAAALHESGWGRSYLARVRHNLFGFNAIDRDPGVANRYPTYEAGIDQTARFIRESYLTPGGRWWAGQPTLRAMQLSWSTSHGWGLSVSGLASGMRLDTFGGSSIAFASPTVSGILHPGETAAVDLHWTGDAIPREVEFAATWQPVALDLPAEAAPGDAGQPGSAAQPSTPLAPPTPPVPSSAPSSGSSDPPAASTTDPAGIAAAAVTVPALRSADGDHDIALRASTPSQPGRYLLTLEMRDAGGGPLPPAERTAITSVPVRIWGTRAAGYEITESADGTSAVIRITNTGLVPIPARQVEPSTGAVPPAEPETLRSVVTVTASAGSPSDAGPVMLVASPLDGDLAPGAAISVDVPAIATTTGRPISWLSVGLSVLGDPGWLGATATGGTWFTASTAAGPEPGATLGPPAPSSTPAPPVTSPPPSPSPAAPPSPSPAPSVPPSPASATTLYQEHSAPIDYSGTWGDAPYAGYLGGDAAWSKTVGSTATFTFSGSSVRWIGPAGPTRGLALVSLDGVPVTQVSLWRSSFVARATLFARSFGVAGPHTLTIEVLSMPSHPYVAIDAFEVGS